MVKFRVLLSLVILIAALFLLFSKLFTPQPIQINLQSGQEITTSTSEFFTLSETLILIISAFLVGTTATYLFYNADKNNITKNEIQNPKTDSYENVMPLLKQDERKIVAALLESNKEMQQNKLAAKLGISKVKATRILYRLEQKNLVTRTRHGLTNMVKLSKAQQTSSDTSEKKKGTYEVVG